MAMQPIEATLLWVSAYSVPASLLQPLVMSHGVCMLLAQPASGILHSVVDLVCHCSGVEGLLLRGHDQSLGVCSDVAFIKSLICVGNVCNF